MWWFIGIVIVVYLWYRYEENKLDCKAEETVRTTSTKYEELTALSNKLVLYDIVIDRSYKIEVNSKQKLDKFDGVKNMMSIVAGNVDRFVTVAQQLADNNDRYKEYKDNFAEILRRNTQYLDDVRCQSKEDELCKNLKRFYGDEDFKLSLTVLYTSPKGRNSYRRDFTFDFDALCEMIKLVRPGWQLRQDIEKILSSGVKSLPASVSGQNEGRHASEIKTPESKSTEVNLSGNDSSTASGDFDFSVVEQEFERKGENMNYKIEKFGSYHGEPITWFVVENKDGQRVLVSEKIIDIKAFHDVQVDTDWQHCNLRDWLQTTFYLEAFSLTEKERIKFVTSGDEETNFVIQEKITLLTSEQVRKYFKNSEARKCEVTDYALDKGAFVYPKTSRFGQWWTRTLASDVASMTYVSPSGNIICKDMPVDSVLGIRPMIVVGEHDEHKSEIKESLMDCMPDNISPDKVEMDFSEYKLNSVMFKLEDKTSLVVEEQEKNGEVSCDTLEAFFEAMADAIKFNGPFWVVRQFNEQSWEKLVRECIRDKKNLDPYDYEGYTVKAYCDNGNRFIPIFTSPVLAMKYVKSEQVKRCLPVGIDMCSTLKNLSYADEQFLGLNLNVGKDNILITEQIRDKLNDMLENETEKEEIEMKEHNVSMVCDGCHKTYDNNFKFCPECGMPLHALVDYAKCSKCGHDIQIGMKFCPECGNKLPVRQGESEKNMPSNDRKNENVSSNSRYKKILFGNYAGESITWLVVEETETTYTLVAEKAIDSIPFNEEKVEVDWEHCSLRRWLNRDFVCEAFSEEEQERLADVVYVNEGNPKYGIDDGDETLDKVCLLSASEMKSFFKNSEERKCEPTAYAIEKGAHMWQKSGCCSWWLRTPGEHLEGTAYVTTSGILKDGTAGVDINYFGVRPMIVVKK